MYFSGALSGPYLTIGVVVSVSPKLLPEIMISAFPFVDDPDADIALPERSEILGGAYDVLSVEVPEYCPPISSLQYKFSPYPADVVQVTVS